VFRISEGGQEPVIDVATVEGIGPAIQTAKPGRYHDHEVSGDPLPSGHTSRGWGIGIKWADGSVASVDHDLSREQVPRQQPGELRQVSSA
jgi:hypothetical protein